MKKKKDGHSSSYTLSLVPVLVNERGMGYNRNGIQQDARSSPSLCLIKHGAEGSHRKEGSPRGMLLPRHG